MSGDLATSYETFTPGDEPPRTPPPAKGARSGAERTRTGGGFAVGALVAAALVTFGFQNTQSVPLHFLWLDGSVPLWVAMAGAALGAAAAIVVLLGGPARKRRRQRRRAARGSDRHAATSTKTGFE